MVEVQASLCPLQQLLVLDVFDGIFGDTEVACKEVVGRLHQRVWQLRIGTPRESRELLSADKNLSSEHIGDLVSTAIGDLLQVPKGEEQDGLQELLLLNGLGKMQ